MPVILSKLSILLAIYRVTLKTQKYFYASFLFGAWLSNRYV